MSRPRRYYLDAPPGEQIAALEAELTEARSTLDRIRALVPLAGNLGGSKLAREVIVEIRDVLLEPSDDQAAGGWTLPYRRGEGPADLFGDGERP